MDGENDRAFGARGNAVRVGSRSSDIGQVAVLGVPEPNMMREATDAKKAECA